MNDILNLLNPKPQYPATGKYYKERPISPDDGAESFNYGYVSTYSNTYRRLFGNMQGNEGQTVIRTDDQCNFAVHGFIITQDGKAFEILQVETDRQAAPPQAMRLFSTPVSTEYVIRLIAIDNPWGIG